MADLYRPLSQMSFVVTLSNVGGGTEPSAAFSEVTGVEATVDVIEFRQGNSASLAPIKVPGMVKHGNITLKFGYTEDSLFRDWVMDCVSEQRPAIDRATVTIELVDTVGKATAEGNVITADTSVNHAWILKNAWVCKYSGVDFNATTSGIAMESVEVAYESLTIPNDASSSGEDTSGEDAKET
ncbi:phage tail protein [Bengtsoniella intestinalis]|uniref:phage tail protein n=1 Tax=Bengtsoniella intestinalis TaxID=3073143 RepID=UPI00391FB34E